MCRSLQLLTMELSTGTVCSDDIYGFRPPRHRDRRAELYFDPPQVDHEDLRRRRRSLLLLASWRYVIPVSAFFFQIQLIVSPSFY